MALVHLPAPYDQLYRRIFLIPFAELQRRCPRTTSHGLESFEVTADFARSAGNPWRDFAVELDDLGDWVGAIPGWAGPVSPALTSDRDELETQLPGEAEWEAGIGRLWVAEALERAGRMKTVVAEDRVRLDTLTWLVHDIETGRVAGLHVRTQRVSSERTVHFEVKRQTFFVDSKLYVLLFLLHHDLSPADFCLLMPSQVIREVGYSETITIDPLTKKFQPYRVATADLGAAFLRATLGR